MVNNSASANVTRGRLSSGEMLAVLSSAGLKPSQISPLSRLNGQPAQPDVRKLQSAGLTDGSGRPVPGFQQALAVLANPAVEIDLIWGNPDGISLSKVYSSGNEKMVAFTGADGFFNLSYFLSPQDITGLLAQKLLVSEIKNVAPFDVEMSPAALAALFGALDVYREEQLRAVLERRKELNVNVTADALNRIFQEAKTAVDFSWYTSVAQNIYPAGEAVTGVMLDRGLKELKNMGLIGAEGDFSGVLDAVAARAFPIAGFFGIKVLTAAAEKTQLALFRGIATLFLAQSAENGKALVSSLSTSQLPELMFNLSSRFKAPAPTPPAAPQTAAAPAAPPPTPRFCKKCGSPLKPGTKFCSKCGAKLT